MIQRYDIPHFCQECGGASQNEDDNGNYILYEDHQKEVKRLREALEKIAKKSVTMIPMRIAKEALEQL